MSQIGRKQASAGLSDQRLEIGVGMLLRTGVLAAAAVVLIGGVLFLVHSGGSRIDYGHFHNEPSNLRSITKIVRGLFAKDAQSIIQFGLLLLIATPILRVVFCAIGFGIERDYSYVSVTATVLVILLYSLLHSI